MGCCGTKDDVKKSPPTTIVDSAEPIHHQEEVDREQEKQLAKAAAEQKLQEEKEAAEELKKKKKQEEAERLQKLKRKEKEEAEARERELNSFNTEPNPLIKEFIEPFFELLEKRKQSDDPEGDDIRAFRPAFNLVEDLLNNFHHQRKKKDTIITELERQATAKFVANVEASLAYPFLSNTSALRLCIRRLTPSSIINNDNTEVPSSSIESKRIKAEKPLRDRTQTSLVTKLNRYKSHEDDPDDAFKMIDDALENGAVEQAGGVIVDTLKELPFVGQFIKPLAVIGKFLYNRARELNEEEKKSNELLKSVANHVTRIARLDQLASLLYIDDEMSLAREKEAEEDGENGNSSSATVAADALRHHQDKVNKEMKSAFEVQETLVDVQLVVARCYDATRRLDENRNKWWEKVANFFVAEGKNELFEILHKLLAEKMDCLVNLVQDNVSIANTARLIRLEQLLMKQERTLTEAEKKSLVVSVRDALGIYYTGTNRFMSSVTNTSYLHHRVYVQPTLQSASRFKTSTPETLLSDANCDCIVIAGTSGSGKSAILKKIAEAQTTDSRKQMMNDVVKDKKKKQKKKSLDPTKSSSKFPGIAIYIDLDHFMKRVLSGRAGTPNSITPLLDVAFSDVSFSSETNHKKTTENLKSIIRNHRVPITWLIDGYERVAAQKQVGDGGSNNNTGAASAPIHEIEKFFRTFATPQGRSQALKENSLSEMVRPCDRVVVAVRPEFVNGLIPGGADGQNKPSSPSSRGRDYVLYNIDPWTLNQMTHFSRKLFEHLPDPKLDPREIESKMKTVIDTLERHQEATPRFVSILCQCFMNRKKKNNNNNNNNHQQTPGMMITTNNSSVFIGELHEVVELYLNTSYASSEAGLPEKVPRDDLEGAGAFALQQYQDGETFEIDPEDYDQQWVRNFTSAGLISNPNNPSYQYSPSSANLLANTNHHQGSSSLSSPFAGTDAASGYCSSELSGSGIADDSCKVLFADAPEFGELLAVLYLRRFPEKVATELRWDARNTNIWLSVAKTFFNPSGAGEPTKKSQQQNNEKIRQDFSANVCKKFIESYSLLRAGVEAALFKTQDKELSKTLRKDIAFIDEKCATTFSFSSASIKPGFSWIKELQQESSLPNSEAITKARTLVENSFHLTLRDNQRFSDFFDVCHGELLAELIFKMTNQEEAKQFLNNLSSAHTELYPNDPRTGFPPFFLWLIGPLGKFAAFKDILQFIDKTFSRFDLANLKMKSGLPETCAKLDEYNPGLAFGIRLEDDVGDSFGGPLVMSRRQLELFDEFGTSQLQRFIKELSSDENNDDNNNSKNNNTSLSTIDTNYKCPHRNRKDASFTCLWNQSLITFYEHTEEAQRTKMEARKYMDFLQNKGAKLTFLESIRYSKTTPKAVQLVIDTNPDEVSANYTSGLQLACRKKSAVVIACLLENVRGRRAVSLTVLKETIQMMARLQSSLDPKILRKIDLSRLSNKLRHVDYLAVIARALRQVTTLQFLSLRNNELDIASVCVLAQELFGDAVETNSANTGSSTNEDDVAMKTRTTTMLTNATDETALNETITTDEYAASTNLSGDGYNDEEQEEEEEEDEEENEDENISNNKNPSTANFHNNTHNGSANPERLRQALFKKIPLPFLKTLDLSDNIFGVGALWIMATALYRRNEIIRKIAKIDNEIATNNNTTDIYTPNPASKPNYSPFYDPSKAVATSLLLGGMTIDEEEFDPDLNAVISEVCQNHHPFTGEMIQKLIAEGDAAGTMMNNNNKKNMMSRIKANNANSDYAASIAACGGGLPSLESLDLRSSSEPKIRSSTLMNRFYSSPITNVLAKLNNNTSIISLDLKQTRVGAKNLWAVFQGSTFLKNIKYLYLEDCALNDGGGSSFFSFLTSYCNTHQWELNHLLIGRNNLGGGSENANSSSSSSVSSLHQEVSNLLHACSNSLERLDLKYNNFGKKVITEILTPALNRKLTSLEQLYIGGNKIGSSELLLDCCKTLPLQVRRMDFSDCGIAIESADTPWFDFIKERVTQKKKLKSLDFSKNMIQRHCSGKFESRFAQAGIGFTYTDDITMNKELAGTQNSASTSSLSNSLGKNGNNNNENNSNKTTADPENSPGQVEVWENQRYGWMAIGWSSSLMPTDRYQFSSKDGKEERLRDGPLFPDSKYIWDGDWSVEVIFPGSTDQDGWTYAVDFPASYSPANFLAAMVRRRKWVRKYRGMKKQ